MELTHPGDKRVWEAIRRNYKERVNEGRREVQVTWECTGRLDSEIKGPSREFDLLGVQ